VKKKKEKRSEMVRGSLELWQGSLFWNACIPV